MLKKQAAQRLPEVESEWPEITILSGPNLVWKLCLKCNFMQKPKMYRSGAAFTVIGKSGENGEFCRSQPAQPAGLSTEFLGLGSEQFENY